jgi:hypothetical protein
MAGAAIGGLSGAALGYAWGGHHGGWGCGGGWGYGGGWVIILI